MSTAPVSRLRAHLFRWKVETPVQTSFGVMHDRPMLLVEATDSDGVTGWGEVWCNFPTVGAEHRARLLESVIAPLVEHQFANDPTRLFDEISAKVAVLALQSGEPGPLAQCIAGVDIALWDLKARRERLPLWKLLGGSSGRVGAYASGINPDRPELTAAAKVRAGYRAVKLKVGFGRERDRGNVRAVRAAVGGEIAVMVDANQAWDSLEALAFANDVKDSDVAWLEEPLRADAPWDEWRRLADECPIALAAGENVAGHAAFDAAIACGALQVLQPDMAKWGGFSACLPVAQRIRAAGLRYCPHFLGGGVGLLASAHLLAAVGGDGLLEVDSNENPLRSHLAPQLEALQDGYATLGDEPGLGVNPNVEALRRFTA